MAKAKAKKARPTFIPNYWRITTEDSYTDIQADAIDIQDGVLFLRNGSKVIAVWNSWRKVERISPPAEIEADPEHHAEEPALEGADA